MLALGRRGRRGRARGRAPHSHRLLLHRPVHDRASRPTRSWPRSAIPRPAGRAAEAPTSSSSARSATSPPPRWPCSWPSTPPARATRSGSASPTSVSRRSRPTAAEAALKGEAAGRGGRSSGRPQLAAEAADPAADLRGSVEYKKDLVRVLTARALRKAVERAERGEVTAMLDQALDQRREARGRRRAPSTAGPPDPGGVAADRHPHRVRHHPLRGLHRPAGRPPVKSCTVFAVQANGQRDHDGGRAGAGRQAPSAPGGLHGRARPAVRLLHARHADDQLRVSQEAPRARPRTTSAGPSPATSAAAPAT